MSLRIIVKTDDAGMAANVGGSVLTTFRSFDVDAPEIEEFLSKDLGGYIHRQAIGIEILADPKEKDNV